MGKLYLSNYQGKRLCDIVVPGSHDAGVYGAGLSRNVLTQGNNIAKQAAGGCRVFDLRIVTQRKKVGGNWQYKQRAFHAMSAKSKTSKSGQQYSKITGGDYGDSLTSMLVQAREYVKGHGTEFVILRFSKSHDYPGIVGKCLDILDGNLYLGGGHLNTKTVGQVKGCVLPVFDCDWGLLGNGVARDGSDGIYLVKSLFAKEQTDRGTYDPTFCGLQYTGKYSDTTYVKKQKNKLKTNIRKQKEMFSDNFGDSAEEVLGMMYWTTTGVFESIKKRDKRMWEGKYAQLESVWEHGMKAAIAKRMSHDDRGSVESLRRMLNSDSFRSFMPNIVMMDFVTQEKCEKVYALNTVAQSLLAQAWKDYMDIEDEEDESEEF